MATAVANTPAPATNEFVARLSAPAKSSAAGAGEASDRFLKLLVTQMQNQDPLNPLDNAQVTSQMAQINTVTGIEKINRGIEGLTALLSDKLGGLAVGSSLDSLNGTLQTLSGQMLQSQALQGANLVGRTVLVEGSSLRVTQGRAIAAFELAGAADRVTVEVLGSAGQVIDSIDLGAQAAGRGGFSWTPPGKINAANLSFRVKAQAGATTVEATPLMTDTVQAVSTGSTGLILELAGGGSTSFKLVKAVS